MYEGAEGGSDCAEQVLVFQRIPSRVIPEYPQPLKDGWVEAFVFPTTLLEKYFAHGV